MTLGRRLRAQNLRKCYRAGSERISRSSDCAERASGSIRPVPPLCRTSESGRANTVWPKSCWPTPLLEWRFQHRSCPTSHAWSTDSSESRAAGRRQAEVGHKETLRISLQTGHSNLRQRNDMLSCMRVIHGQSGSKRKRRDQCSPLKGPPQGVGQRRMGDDGRPRVLRHLRPHPRGGCISPIGGRSRQLHRAMSSGMRHSQRKISCARRVDPFGSSAGDRVMIALSEQRILNDPRG